MKIGASIVVARNLGLGKKDREQVHPSVEKFLKSIIDANGLDLSNTINLALEKLLREKGYLSPDVLDMLGCCSDIELSIFENGIEATAQAHRQNNIQLLLQ